MASRLGDMPLDKPDRALTWLKAFQALARAKGWKDEGSNIGIVNNFLATCGLSALEKLESLVAPRQVESLPFIELEKALRWYLQPHEKLTVAERTRFFHVSQSPNELIGDFLSRLRKAASDCKFDDLKACVSPAEELIRMALIAGLYDPRVQQRLLEAMQAKDMSVVEIVDFVRGLEQVATFCNRPNAAAASSVVHRPDKVLVSERCMTVSFAASHT